MTLQEGASENRLFYLSTPPSVALSIVHGLGIIKLSSEEKGWSRVVVEKPFGRDLESARALNDLIAGVIEVAFDPGVGLPHARSGKLRMIAVAGPKRHADFPDVPTLAENGFKTVDGGPNFGFYAPAATPPNKSPPAGW